MDLGLDRRSSKRISAVGTTILTMDNITFEGVPLDVSAGGARIRLSYGNAQRLPWPGARLRLDFIRRLGRPAFSVDSVVVRTSRDGQDLSLRFELDDFGAARLARFLDHEAAELGIPVADLGEVVISRPGSPTPPEALGAPAASPRYAQLVGWIAAAAGLAAAAWLLLN